MKTISTDRLKIRYSLDMYYLITKMNSQTIIESKSDSKSVGMLSVGSNPSSVRCYNQMYKTKYTLYLGWRRL